MEILVLHPGALGDVLLSLPALWLMRECRASSRITLACNSDYFELLKSTCVDKLIPFSTLPLHRFYLSEPLPAADVSFWRSYDRILSWTGFGLPDFANNFSRIHPCVRIASWHPGPGESRHAARLFVDSLSDWISGPAVLPEVRLILDAPADQAGKAWLGGHGWKEGDVLIGIHPGAGGMRKRWPAGSFRLLLQRLLQGPTIRILVVEGPAEVGLSMEVARDFPAQRIIVAAAMPLLQLAALLKRCFAFVGNDSGVAHLAGVLGIPSVVLFGPTMPQHWAPLGSHVRVLRDARGCAACAAGVEANHTCLENITPDQVLHELESLTKTEIPEQNAKELPRQGFAGAGVDL